MRISDWSSDVCSSDLFGDLLLQFGEEQLHHRSTHRVGRAAPREDRLPAIERVQTLQHDLCLAQRMVERVELARLLRVLEVEPAVDNGANLVDLFLQRERRSHADRKRPRLTSSN